jgi:hypothetical protein
VALVLLMGRKEEIAGMIYPKVAISSVSASFVALCRGSSDHVGRGEPYPIDELNFFTSPTWLTQFLSLK